jgi:ubiquinone biosynthesis protein UbiJ
MLAALPRILSRMIDREAARGFTGTVALRVRPDDTYELAFADGDCTVRRGGNGAAQATVTADAADLVRLVAGRVTWYRLLGAGRMELDGDPYVAVRFPSLLGLTRR